MLFVHGLGRAKPSIDLIVCGDEKTHKINILYIIFYFDIQYIDLSIKK